MKDDKEAWISMFGWCANWRNKPKASRRDILKVSALLALTPFITMDVTAADDSPASDAPPSPNAIAPADALKRLIDGNERYATNMMNERDFSAGRAARALVQYPIAAILSCADSRVAPEFAFDQGPGHLFVVRVAGNIVTPDLLASLEYGVQFLGVPLIMVLGHSSCGAVDSAIKVLRTKAVLPGKLPELIATIKPAVMIAEKAKSDNLLDRAIAANVRQQVAKLKRSPPVIQKLYESKKIDVVGAVYDIPTGKITLV